MNAVYDITIAYAKNRSTFQNAPTFAQSLMVPAIDKQWRFFVHVDRYAVEELPEGDDELASWLEDRWIAKGNRLETLRQRLEKGLPWEPF